MEHNSKLHNNIVSCGKYLHLTKANPLGTIHFLVNTKQLHNFCTLPNTATTQLKLTVAAKVM